MWNWPTTICLAQLRTVVFVTPGYVMECYGLDMMCTIYDDNVMDMMAMLWIGYDVGCRSWIGY